MDRKNQPKRKLNNDDGANKRVKETKTTVCNYTHPVNSKIAVVKYTISM